MSQNILEVMIKNIITNIKAAGYEDPTNEIITCTYSGNIIKFRLYTEQKWNDYLSSQNDAKKLATKLGFGEKPDHVVVHSDIIYYVKII